MKKQDYPFIVFLLLIMVMGYFVLNSEPRIDHFKGQSVFIPNEGFIDGSEYIPVTVVEVYKDSLLVSIDAIKEIGEKNGMESEYLVMVERKK